MGRQIAMILCKAQEFIVKRLFPEYFHVRGRSHHYELKYAHCIALNQFETLHTYFPTREFPGMLPLNQIHLQGYFNSITRESVCWRNPSSPCITHLALDKVLWVLGFEMVFSEHWGFWISIFKSTWALSPSRTCSWAGFYHSRHCISFHLAKSYRFSNWIKSWTTQSQERRTKFQWAFALVTVTKDIKAAWGWGETARGG